MKFETFVKVFQSFYFVVNTTDVRITRPRTMRATENKTNRYATVADYVA